MKYYWLTIRGLAFWLGVFYAFTLAWSPFQIDMLPSSMSVPVILAPVLALIFGAVVPDKAFLNGRGTEVMLFVVLTLGIAAVATMAIDDYSARRMEGIWFDV